MPFYSSNEIHLVNLCERTSNNERRGLYGLTESIPILTTSIIIILIGLSSLTHVKYKEKKENRNFYSRNPINESSNENSLVHMISI